MHSESKKYMNPTKFKKSKGFTLMEVLIAIVIAGILSTMAVPAFNQFLESSRLKANTSLIIGALNLARSEAVRLGQSVRFEEVGTGGWQLVVATGPNINELLRSFEPSDKDITLAGVSDITYRSTGFRDFVGNAEVTMNVCDSHGKGIDIKVSSGGSVSSEESSSC